MCSGATRAALAVSVHELSCDLREGQLNTTHTCIPGGLSVSQAPLRGCRCEPLLRKLENQLQATKEEMKTEVHTVQGVINSKVGQQELRSRQQVTHTAADVFFAVLWEV